LSKKKVTVILCIVAFLVLAVCGYMYFFVVKSSQEDNFAKLREGMKPWENISAQGISVYVPEDYEYAQNEFYSQYLKGSAKVTLTSEAASDDVANYAYYAVRKYEEITDSFMIRTEYDDTVAQTPVHVVEFDYSLNLDSGIKTFSCLSAYELGNGRAYVLTCVCDSAEFSQHLEEFHRIYKTMALTGSEDR